MFKDLSMRIFLAHFVAFVVITAGCAAVNLWLKPQHLWFPWVLMGWGIAVATHDLALLLRKTRRRERIFIDRKERAFTVHLFAYVAVILLLLLYRDFGTLARRAAAAAAFLGGFLVAIAPFTLRNWLVSGQFVLLVNNYISFPMYLLAPGDVARNGLLAPFDAYLTDAARKTFATESVGKSWESYQAHGRQWALHTSPTSHRCNRTAWNGGAPR